MKSPYLRLPLAVLFLVPVLVGQGVILGATRHRLPIPVALITGAAAAAVGLWVYRFEHRPVAELSRAGAWREFGAGLLLGALLFSATIGVLALLGGYRVTGLNGWKTMLVPLGLSLSSGVVEELLFRGAIFRLLEERLGSWIALAISSLLFGLIHLSNPNATLQGAVAIVFEAGVMLAAAYLLTRRLWMAIGIHMAWNFTQSGIFGVPTSGFAIPGLLVGELSGPEWLSGGAFGVEASLVALLICCAAGCALLWRAWRVGHLVRPYWRRPERMA